VAADAENPLSLFPSVADDKTIVQKEWDLRFGGELCVVRRDAAGAVTQIAMGNGKFFSASGVVITQKQGAECVEVRLL
jgi:hypothetical protein